MTNKIVTREIRSNRFGWYGVIIAVDPLGRGFTRYMLADGRLNGVGQYFNKKEQTQFLLDQAPKEITE